MRESAPEIDEAPDVSREALQALRGELLVISLVGCKSGKVLPVADATRIAHDAGATAHSTSVSFPP